MNYFSEREKQIIKIIGRKKLTLEQISSELFKMGNRPLDSEIAVGNSVRRIIKKCSFHKLEWTLNKERINNKLIITKEKL